MIKINQILIKRETILMVSLFLWAQVTLGQIYNFKKLSAEDGLSGRGVYSMCEGPEGKLWIGLEGEGVNIYDGWNVEHYTENHLGQNIRTILKDSKKRMWFGSVNQGVSILEKGKVIKLTTNNGLFVNHIRGIVEGDNGLFWVATLGGGVSIIEDDEVVRNLNAKDGLPSLRCRAVLKLKSGAVWVGTDKGIAVIVDGEVIKIINKQKGLIADKVLSLYEDSESKVWVGTEKGLSVFKGEDRMNIRPENGLRSGRIKSIVVKENGNAWFGTKTGLGKVSILDFDTKEYELSWFDDRNGLSNNRVRCIYQDASKALWIGTFKGGVNRLFNESFSIYNKSNGLLDNIITALSYNVNDSSLWIGSLDYGVDVWRENELIRINQDGGISNNHITSIAHLKGGATIVGTVEGVNLINDFEFTQVWDDYSGVFSSNKIIDLVSNGKEVLGITENNELFLLRDTGKVILDLFASASLKTEFNSYVNGISVIDGVFWVGEDSIFKSVEIINGKVKTLKSVEVGKVVKSVGVKNDFVGFTTDNKLFRAVDGKLVWDFKFEKSEEVKFILFEGRNTYWIGLKSRIMRLKFNKGKGLDTKYYSLNEGFMGLTSERLSVTKDLKNDIYVGTIRGLLKVKPNNYKGVKRDLKVYLTNLTEENTKVKEWGGFSDSIVNGIPVGLKLPYTMNHLTFNYKAYHLKSPKEIKYKLTLIGDEAFTFETNKIEEEFVELSPGEYTLKISAKTQWGEWSEKPLIFQFEITPPFWLAKSFQISVVLLLGGMIFIVFKLRTKKLQREKKKLENLVAVRTKDLNEEKQKSEKLLLNILPLEVANELKVNGVAKTRKYESASVLFTDFKGFTKMSAEISPEVLVRKLDEIFVAFDEVIERNGLEKIKTIGDAYMCASGIPDENLHQVRNAVLAGIQLIEVINTFNNKQRLNSEPEWDVRVGIHTGELIAGVVGKKKFAYDIWGDTVNIASRMESNSEAGKVNISEETFKEIEGFFDCEPRGRIIAKNRGKLEMFFVSGLKDQYKKSESTLPNQSFYID